MHHTATPGSADAPTRLVGLPLPRDLAKTLSFAALHFGVAFGVAYALTGSIGVASGVARIEPLVNTVAFYFHERAWARVERRPPGRDNALPACCGLPGSR